MLPHWEARIHELLDADSPECAISDPMACVEFANTAKQLAALVDVIGSYRANEKRMRYQTFRSLGLAVGSGIAQSAHRHVLQVRMKSARQRWRIMRARHMVRLRAVYDTAGAVRFHRAVRDGFKPPTATRKHRLQPNSPRRAKHTYT